MRIHWFSPCSPERTDIGHFTLRVCSELKKRCDLTLWTHPQHFAGRKQPEWRTELQTYPYSDLDARLPLLNRADTIFYNIGNNAKYHREILMAMRRAPGVAIMHDRSLFECISSVYRERPDGDRLFLDLADAVYGAEARAEIARWLERKTAIGDLATRYPFSTHASLGAWGTIHHTDRTADDEGRASDWPDWTLPLPYPTSPLANLPKFHERDGRLHCIIFGYIGGPNRRLSEVLQALQAHPDRQRIHLRIAGEIHPDLGLDKEIAYRRLDSNVTLCGFLPDAELDRLLRQSDLVINLRYPTRGEASGSLLRAWNQAAPSIVTDDGSYRDLPDSVVWKVDPLNEIKDLQAVITRLLNDRQEAQEKGDNGRYRLEQQHNVSNYVEALLKIARTSSARRGPSIAPMLEQRYALFAHGLFKLQPEAIEPALDSLDRELSAWFAPVESPLPADEELAGDR